MNWTKKNIQQLHSAEYSYWYSLMDRAKQKHVDRFRFLNDKKRTVVGEMLSRKAISEWCGVKPESITFAVGDHGKPYAVDLNVEFNVSHSGDLVVCAVDDYPVGIDVELIRPIDMDFVYTKDKKILTRFFEVWTRYEAMIKINDKTNPKCFFEKHPVITIKHLPFVVSIATT